MITVAKERTTSYYKNCINEKKFRLEITPMTFILIPGIFNCGNNHDFIEFINLLSINQLTMHFLSYLNLLKEKVKYSIKILRIFNYLYYFLYINKREIFLHTDQLYRLVNKGYGEVSASIPGTFLDLLLDKIMVSLCKSKIFQSGTK